MEVNATTRSVKRKLNTSIKQDKLNKYIRKQESLKERSSQLQRENESLRQQLDDTQNEAEDNKKALFNILNQFQESVKELQTEYKNFVC